MKSNSLISYIVFFLFIRNYEVVLAQKENSGKEMYLDRKNALTLTTALKENPENVKTIFIQDYSDTIFPNNDLLKFKNIEHIIIYGKWSLRKKKKEPIEKPTKFYIDTNRLHQFSNLKYLEFGKIDFNKFPTELLFLRKLKGLSIEDSFIDSLPKEISNLKSLTVLSLRLNNIKILPKEIFNLDSLVALDLTNNSLTKLPKEILQMRNLKILCLSNLETNIDQQKVENKWPFPVNLNNIDYLLEKQLLINILKMPQLVNIAITVDYEKKIELKNEIKDKKILRKIFWDIK